MMMAYSTKLDEEESQKTPGNVCVRSNQPKSVSVGWELQDMKEPIHNLKMLQKSLYHQPLLAPKDEVVL